MDERNLHVHHDWSILSHHLPGACGSLSAGIAGVVEMLPGDHQYRLHQIQGIQPTSLQSSQLVSLPTLQHTPHASRHIGPSPVQETIMQTTDTLYTRNACATHSPAASRGFSFYKAVCSIFSQLCASDCRSSCKPNYDPPNFLYIYYIHFSTPPPLPSPPPPPPPPPSNDFIAPSCSPLTLINSCCDKHVFSQWCSMDQ